MKVLFLAGSVFGTGGIEKFNRNLLNALTEAGSDLSVISINDKKPQTPPPYEFKPCKSTYRIISKIRLSLFFIFHSLKSRPDLVICGHVNISPLGHLIKKLFGIDYMVITHGSDVWDIKSMFKMAALKKAMLILCVSNFTKKRLVDQIPEIEDRICILPNTVDGGEFYPKEKDAKLVNKYGLNGRLVLLTVTRLSSRDKCKGYDKVLASLPRILKKVPNAKYLIVGSGDDTPRIKKTIRDMGLEDQVLLTGYVPQKKLVDHYNLCDVFVMPSTKEGFGIVYLEALACGKPVIAGNEDGSVDALLNGELGVLVDTDNINEIADEIIKVLKKEVPERLLNAEYLRKRVLEVYGLDKFKERVKEVITCKLE